MGKGLVALDGWLLVEVVGGDGVGGRGWLFVGWKCEFNSTLLLSTSILLSSFSLAL